MGSANCSNGFQADFIKETGNSYLHIFVYWLYKNIIFRFQISDNLYTLPFSNK